jgi:hypothetical protein
MSSRVVYGIVAALLLAACAQSERAPTAPLPLLGLGNDPDRIRIRDQRREPFTLTVVGCLDAPIVVTGSVNYILQAQDNPADNVHFRLHTNLQGVSGVSATTGTRYRLAETFNATYNYVFLESPRFETTQIFRYRLIGDRPRNNSWVNISLHTTITPDGRISSTRSEAEAGCAEEGQ